MVGEGNDRPRLEHKARLVAGGQPDTLSRVRAAGVARRLLPTASVFALPSRGEGFGLVYLEAMAHGLPCIGSRQDAAGDVIVDGTTGHLVDQTDTARSARESCSCWPTNLSGSPWATPAGAASWREFSEAAFGARLVAALEAAFDDDSR